MLTVIKKSRKPEGFLIILTLSQWVLMTPENQRWIWGGSVDCIHPKDKILSLALNGEKKNKGGMEGGLKEEGFLSTTFSWWANQLPAMEQLQNFQQACATELMLSYIWCCQKPVIARSGASVK